MCDLEPFSEIQSHIEDWKLRFILVAFVQGYAEYKCDAINNCAYST